MTKDKPRSWKTTFSILGILTFLIAVGVYFTWNKQYSYYIWGISGAWFIPPIIFSMLAGSTWRFKLYVWGALLAVSGGVVWLVGYQDIASFPFAIGSLFLLIAVIFGGKGTNSRDVVGVNHKPKIDRVNTATLTGMRSLTPTTPPGEEADDGT